MRLTVGMSRDGSSAWAQGAHPTVFPALREAKRDYAMTASSLRLSPLVSVQLTTTLSPLAPPLKLKFMTGFCDTAGPNCAERTVLPFHVAVTVWI